MKIEEMLITPEVAEKMLRKNTRNRPLNANHLADLCGRLQRGEWKKNGDSVRFNGTELIDGQHRLAACVKTGVSFETLVISELDCDVFDTIDTGKVRSAVDYFALQNVPSSVCLVAALRYLDWYNIDMPSKQPKLSNTQVWDMYQRNPSIIESVRAAGNYRTRLLSPALMAVCHYLFAQKDEVAADSFMARLANGYNLKEHEPLALLHQKLLDNKLSKAKLRPRNIMGLTITAWNAQRQGKSLRVLRFTETGPAAQRFPKVI